MRKCQVEWRVIHVIFAQKTGVVPHFLNLTESGFVLKPSSLARQEKIGPSLCEAPRELNEAAMDSKGP